MCRAGLKSRCWVNRSQQRLFTAVRLSDVPHRPEAPVLGEEDTQHRLFTAVRLSDVPRRPEEPDTAPA